MDTYERHPSYKKPVLSNPAGVFHLFFQYQAQIQRRFFLKIPSLLFPLDVILRRTSKFRIFWLRNIVLIRHLENRAALDSVPSHMYEPN